MSHEEDLDVSHRECFACGAYNGVGLRLHFEVSGDGVAMARWKPTAAFRSYPDRVHGGVIATLLDSSIVHALFAQGIAGVTAEMTVRYLRGMNVVDEVCVRGWVESTRHGIHFCRAEARQAESLVVKAAAKFMPYRDL